MHMMLGTGQSQNSIKGKLFSLLVNTTYFAEGITKETVLCSF